MVVDMQNGFVSPNGSLARLGLDVSRNTATVAPIRRLIDAWHGVDGRVVFTEMSFQPNYADAGLIPERFPPLQALGHLIAGSWDAAIIDDLVPGPNDIVLHKSRFNPFYGTGLALRLRQLGVTTLVITGVATNICVDSAAREAFIRDFRVVIPREATASYTREMEEASLATLGFMFADVVPVDEVLCV
jgi:ureidoacrylate peracid hydrolase